MADKMDEAEFWLPSEFLTDEDILMGNKENFSKYALAHSNPAGLSLSPMFPYDYGGSPVDCLVGSAETESDEEDALLTGLTQRLTLRDVQKLTSYHQNPEKKNRVLSGSPQSTLTQVGSWSGRSTVSSNGSPNGPSQVSSPPTTPLGSNNDAWDLIYQAAGQVARLKMNARDGFANIPSLMAQQKCVTTPPPLNYPALPSLHDSLWHQLNGEQVLSHEGCGMWSGRQLRNQWSYDQEAFQTRSARAAVAARGGSAVSGGPVPSSGARPSLQPPQINQQQFGELRVRGGVGYGQGFRYGSGGGGCGGGGFKRECAGTGVFLPRRYASNNNPCNLSDSRKKLGSSALLQNRGIQVVNNKNYNNTSAIVHPQSGGAAILNHDTSLARRNELLTQKRRNLCPDASINHEICLPQEWTY